MPVRKMMDNKGRVRYNPVNEEGFGLYEISDGFGKGSYRQAYVRDELANRPLTAEEKIMEVSVDLVLYRSEERAERAFQDRKQSQQSAADKAERDALEEDSKTFREVK